MKKFFYPLLFLALLSAGCTDPLPSFGWTSSGQPEVYTQMNPWKLIELSDPLAQTQVQDGRVILVWSCKVKNNYKSAVRVEVKIYGGTLRGESTSHKTGLWDSAQAVIPPHHLVEIKREKVISNLPLGDLTWYEIRAYTLGYFIEERSLPQPTLEGWGLAQVPSDGI